MAVQDLTPQLRTRLSRVERVVGVFVSIATLLLLAGFGYYIYHTGARKGWWKFKAEYHTFLETASGLSVGSPVTLLGFTVGQITKIEAEPPENIIWADYGNVYVQFYVLEPYQGYIWNDSEVQVTGDLFGGRMLTITPGGASLQDNPGAVLFASYKQEEGEYFFYDRKKEQYVPAEGDDKGFMLFAEESIPVTERLEMVANQVQAALPGILDMTNRINQVLSNAAGMTSEAESVLSQVQPAIANLTLITSNLTDPAGSLGEWILPTNMHSQLVTALTNVNQTLTNVNQAVVNTDSNVTALATSLEDSLINLANITSNLNVQVQNNPTILSNISETITEADRFMQGLKEHWLLRGAFKRAEEKAQEAEQGPEAREQQTRPENAPGIPPPQRAGKWRDYP